jgi:predicted dehydrogenase
VQVRGVLGSSPERGAERAAAIRVPGLRFSEELLADPGVDVVHVTSPNQAHYGQVKAILAAGKHVVCEKPLAMTAAQSAEMVALGRASGRIARSATTSGSTR